MRWKPPKLRLRWYHVRAKVMCLPLLHLAPMLLLAAQGLSVPWIPDLATRLARVSTASLLLSTALAILARVLAPTQRHADHAATMLAISVVELAFIGGVHLQVQ